MQIAIRLQLTLDGWTSNFPLQRVRSSRCSPSGRWAWRSVHSRIRIEGHSYPGQAT